MRNLRGGNYHAGMVRSAIRARRRLLDNRTHGDRAACDRVARARSQIGQCRQPAGLPAGLIDAFQVGWMRKRLRRSDLSERSPTWPPHDTEAAPQQISNVKKHRNSAAANEGELS
jgi:hypothetical protein